MTAQFYFLWKNVESVCLKKKIQALISGEPPQWKQLTVGSSASTMNSSCSQGVKIHGGDRWH